MLNFFFLTFILETNLRDMESKRKKVEKDYVKMKHLDFIILDYKHKFYNKKALLTVGISVEGKLYDTQFLMDDYEVAFYPEFRTVERYSSGTNADAILMKFLKNFQMKIKYFADNYSDKIKAERGMNSWDDLQEWWQKEDLNDEINNAISNWVYRNKEYLSQGYLDEIQHVESFNEGVDQIENYLNKRKGFVMPTDIILSTEKVPEDIGTLKIMLSSAIEEERYDDAAVIRDKINDLG